MKSNRQNLHQLARQRSQHLPLTLSQLHHQRNLPSTKVILKANQHLEVEILGEGILGKYFRQVQRCGLRKHYVFRAQGYRRSSQKSNVSKSRRKQSTYIHDYESTNSQISSKYGFKSNSNKRTQSNYLNTLSARNRNKILSQHNPPASEFLHNGASEYSEQYREDSFQSIQLQEPRHIVQEPYHIVQELYHIVQEPYHIELQKFQKYQNLQKPSEQIKFMNKRAPKFKSQPACDQFGQIPPPLQADIINSEEEVDNFAPKFSFAQFMKQGLLEPSDPIQLFPQKKSQKEKVVDQIMLPLQVGKEVLLEGMCSLSSIMSEKREQTNQILMPALKTEGGEYEGKNESKWKEDKRKSIVFEEKQKIIELNRPKQNNRESKQIKIQEKEKEKEKESQAGKVNHPEKENQAEKVNLAEKVDYTPHTQVNHTHTKVNHNYTKKDNHTELLRQQFTTITRTEIKLQLNRQQSDIPECCQITQTIPQPGKSSQVTIKYNLKFLQNRSKQTEVIRVSPLRFRKKEKVVQELVKRQIIPHQSSSIVFP